jgi:hypothetical protein
MYEPVYAGREVAVNLFRPWYGQFAGITVQKAHANVNSNTRDGTSTLIFRVNTIDSVLAISIPAATTGNFYDSTHQITFGDGDSISLFFTAGGSSGWLALQKCLAETTIPNEYTRSLGRGGVAQLKYNMDQYIVFQCMIGVPDIGNGQRLADQVFTASRFSLYVLTNTLNVTRTIGWMTDGVLGNQNITVTPGLTGLLSDITHTDEVSLSQYITAKWTASGVGSGQANVRTVQYVATFPQPSGHPYIVRVQGIPGMRTFSQLGHGGL